jgi:hypothetical protein
MRVTLFKIIMFLAAFIFLQGVILPWTISNNMLPLWGDILLLSFILMMWVVVIDRISAQLLNKFKDEDDLTSD